jgi:hypothetical protein
MASANALIPINDTVPDPTLQEGMKTEGDFLDEEEGQKEAAPANKKGDGKNPDKRPASRARELRLEQNRKAAKESRRRKKMMIEGTLMLRVDLSLTRVSVFFFIMKESRTYDLIIPNCSDIFNHT